MTTQPEQATASRPATFMPSQSLWQRVPWLWSDFVARLPVPLWVPSVLIFLFLYGMGIILAVLDGELQKFLLDIRWLFTFGLPAFASFTLGYTPRALDRLWASLKPWLAGSEEEHSTFWATTHDGMGRLFWGSVLLFVVLFSMYYFVPGVDNISPDYAHPEIMHNWILLSSSFSVYLGPGAIGLAGLGLVSFTRSMSRNLKFRRDFILQGGKATLQPLRQLLWVIWGTVALPNILGVGITTAPISSAQIRIVDIASLLTATVLLLPIIFVPQEFVSQLLAKQKAEDLRALQQELAEVASASKARDSSETLHRLLRHEHLVYQIQQVQNFNPSLIDARFVIQIALSVAAIISANIVMSTVGLR